MNPFATEEDDDDSDDGEGGFTIGDLEAEEEGMGHLPPGTALVGDKESLDDLGLQADKNVGSILPGPSLVVSSFSALNSRAAFPNLWPFGGSSPEFQNQEHDGSRGGRTALADDAEQSSDEEDDSDDEYGAGHGHAGKRRLSVTTEAKRRTSLEDDDEDEVVHVGMAEAREVEGENDEGLVEIQHAEMQGVEERK